MSDSINPNHYKRLPVEAIEIIESAIQQAPSEQAAYLQGQALKYLLRCNHKGQHAEDIQKAKWYLDRLVESVVVPSLDRVDYQPMQESDFPFDEPKPVPRKKTK